MVNLVLSLVEEFVASSNTVGRSVSMNKLIVWITFCPRSEVQVPGCSGTMTRGFSIVLSSVVLPFRPCRRSTNSLKLVRYPFGRFTYLKAQCNTLAHMDFSGLILPRGLCTYYVRFGIGKSGIFTSPYTRMRGEGV